MIWVSGSIARDYIMDFSGRFRNFIDPKKIHVLNLSFAVSGFKESLGGTASNICYNLSLLGLRSGIIGAVNRDERALHLRFGKLGIDLSCLKLSRKRTAGAYIITDRDNNQITAFEPGAMNESSRLPRARSGDWAIVAAENPRNMAKLARFYAAKKINYIFDPGQQITALSKRDLAWGLRGAKILMGNDYEIGLIGKRVKLFAPVVVKTLGALGSEILAKNRRIKIGIARPRQVLDPTGAGDAYRAGFLKGLVLGYNLKVCAALGAVAASYAVERFGTQEHRFSKGEFMKRLKKNFPPFAEATGVRQFSIFNI